MISEAEFRVNTNGPEFVKARTRDVVAIKTR